MTTNEDLPPFSDEQWEQISVARYELHKRYWKELASFAYVPNAPDEPPIPTQPKTFLKTLKRYALDLFECEYGRYSSAPKRHLWAGNLAERVERMVMENVSKLEANAGSFNIQASNNEIHHSVHTALDVYVSSLALPEADRVSLATASEESANGEAGGLSFADALSELKRKTGMTDPQIAVAVNLTVRSVYKHRAGGRIRATNQAAYRALFAANGILVSF